MLKYFIPSVCLLLMATLLQAQTPKNISLDGGARMGEASALKMDCNNAGTITFGTFSGQSNDTDPAGPIFLCLGDQYPIIHDGNGDLMGDPQPSTPAGIGYAFYNCAPTVTGPALANIVADPCTNSTSPIIVGGMPIPQTNNIWVATENINGNLTLNNNGSLQSSFNGGVPAPIQFWFAPITIDNFATIGYESSAVGQPAGPCVDANVNEAFNVVYLNAIQATELNTTASPTGCVGSFRIRGGLPEWIVSEAYTISIRLQTNPSVVGTFSGVPNHDDVITFTVPTPGTYDITVEDGKSCGATFTMNMSGCQTVVVTMPVGNVPPGQNICLDVTVDNFANVNSAQFTLNFDPAVLTFTNINGAHPAIAPLGVPGNFGNIGGGRLTFSWNTPDPTMGITIPNGETIFQLCFDVIGALGTFSPMTITSTPTPIEIGAPTVPLPTPYGVTINNGIVVVSNDLLFVFVEQDSVTCAGDSDGAFTVTLASGTAPYQFTWRRINPNGPVSAPVVVTQQGGSATVNNLAAGEYQIVVQDASNPVNMVTRVVEVLSPASLGVSLQTTSPSCNGLMDGSIRAIVSLDNVNQPMPADDLVFTWSISTMINTDSISGLSANINYGVTITDGSGCTVSSSAVLSQPQTLVVTNANTTIVPASCTGVSNGSITITATGGTQFPMGGGYSYAWDNGLGTVMATNATVANLAPGEYCVTVTDANGCSVERCFNVIAQKTLSVNGLVTDASCNGVCDGSVFATGSTAGAMAATPYAFNWSNGFTNSGNTSEPQNLCAGTYTVTMTDADPAGCQVIDTFTVNEPLPLVAAVLEQINETCNAGGMDGSITLGVSGGTLPYTYTWSHDAMLSDSIATGLAQNNYTVDITDANGCVQMLSVDILAPVPPMVTQLLDDFVSCAGGTDGTLTVTAVPGAAPIASYNWTGNLTGATITGLSPGLYIVTITDASNCTTIDSAFVNSPPPLSIDSTSIRLPDCPGFTNGRVGVFVSGGTSPYSFIWSTNPGVPTTNNPLPGLAAGTYTVTVTDANSCAALVETIVLPDPPSIDVSFANIVSVTCPNDATCNGGATATALYSDGTAGQFNFIWASGETDLNVVSSTASMLCRNQQSLTVSDGVCGVELTVNIPSPPNFEVNSNPQPVSCFGLSDGSIALSPTGATAPYTYNWPALGNTTSTVSNLVAGLYTAIITDANNCVFEQTVPVVQPDRLILSIDAAQTTSSVSCGGDTDGVIAVMFNNTDQVNPVGPAPYTWSNNVAPPTSAIATNLAAGTYSVTITDTKGCTDMLTYSISEPPPLVFIVATPLPPNCFGEQTLILIESASGGTGTMLADYEFEVDNNGLTFPATQGAPVFAGQHTVTIVDPSGCTQETSLFIPQPEPITISLPTEVVIELGDTLTRLMPQLSGGTQPYTSFLWSPLGDLSSDTVLSPFVDPIDDRLYTLLVTDANGCAGQGSVFVRLDAARNVYVPNVFSPNGDGRNDEFRVFTCRGVSAVNFARVYDRWGGEVYTSTNLIPSCENGVVLWDGRQDGRPANPGMYVYIIEIVFRDGRTLLYRGDVTLAR